MRLASFVCLFFLSFQLVAASVQRVPVPAPDHGPVVLEIPSAWLLEGDNEVEIELRNGERALVREVSAHASPAEAGVLQVRFLAADDAFRSDLCQQLSSADFRAAELHLRINGIPVAVVPWGDISEAVDPAEQALRQPGEELRVFRELPASLPPLEALTASSCESQCFDDYEDCRTACGPGEPCPDCFLELEWCLQDCPPQQPQPCVDPKSVTQSVQTTSCGTSFLGGNCYTDHWFVYPYQPRWYNHYQYCYKDTTIQTTTYCNGTTSQVTLGTSYRYFFCYYRTWSPCGFSAGFPGLTCN